jgi:hypothetical protein
MADPIAGAWGWLTSLAHRFFYVSVFCITTGFIFLLLSLLKAISVPIIIDVRLIFFGFAIELWKYSDGWADWIQRCFAIVLLALTFTPMKFLLHIYQYLAS